MNLRICPHICLDQKIEDNFEFEINWQKPYIINMECQKSVQPDLKRSGDTSYIGPCTGVNADGVPKVATLSGHQHITLYKIGCKKANKITH